MCHQSGVTRGLNEACGAALARAGAIQEAVGLSTLFMSTMTGLGVAGLFVSLPGACVRVTAPVWQLTLPNATAVAPQLAFCRIRTAPR